jgi:ABC-type glutathione transport system ATPase component
MLSLKDIYTDFGSEVPANDHVTLTLHPNEVFGLTGESGCGKTTLSNVTLGLPIGHPGFCAGQVLFTPSGGEAFELYSRYLPLAWTAVGNDAPPKKRWFGFGHTLWQLMSHVSIKGVERALGRKVRGGLISRVVSTSTALNDYKTVEQQLTRTIQLHRKNHEPNRIPSPVSLLERVGLGDIRNRKPTRLSGGERTRVAIALGLACNPFVFIADETTTGLDVIKQREIVESLFLGFKASWKTDPHSYPRAILLITHDIGILNNLCDRVAVMKDGKIVEVLTREDDAGALQSQDFSEQYPQDLIRNYYEYTMVSQRPGGRFFDPEATADTSILELENLCIRFPKVQEGGLREVKLLGKKLVVNRGEHVAVVGQTGCGKTTLGKTICHLNDIVGVLSKKEQELSTADSLSDYAHRTSGIDLIILNEGYSMKYRSNQTGNMEPIPSPEEAEKRRHFHNQVQMLYQHSDRALFDKMTVRELLNEAYETYFHLHPDARLPQSSVTEKLEGLIAQVQLPKGRIDVYPHQLSEGQRRRISFLRTLISAGYTITEKQGNIIIVADEPTSGIDVMSANILLDIIADLIKKSGVTLILITHDLRLVNLLCPRVWVMQDGQVTQQYRTAEILDENLRLIPHADIDEYTQTLINSIPRPDERYS